jgi:hypothetical protein
MKYKPNHIYKFINEYNFFVFVLKIEYISNSNDNNNNKETKKKVKYFIHYYDYL